MALKTPPILSLLRRSSADEHVSAISQTKLFDAFEESAGIEVQYNGLIPGEKRKKIKIVKKRE